jgi:APA family basic amino acid/polyamine antiporter
VPTQLSPPKGQGERKRMANLLATKPLNLLMEEARETGEHSLKRTLGVFQLTALGVGAIIGAGIFVMVGLGAQYAGPGLTLSFVLSGLGCAFAGLCYAEFAAMIPLAGSAYTYAYATLGELLAWIIGWDLTLEYAMGASTVSSGWSNHFIELLNIFHIKMPLWLAYDHWTALKTAENVIARQMAQTADASLVPGTQTFLDRVGAIVSAQSPELLERAHALLGAPHLFGMEIGLNLPAFIIAMVITAILVVGIKESARFNTGIVVIKVSVVLFVIALGSRYINSGNWGTDWHSFAPHGFAGIGAGAAYIFFAYIGFDAVSTTAQEAKNPQRDLPIGMIAALAICTVLYIAVAGVLTGMVHWQQINIEAPVARAFLDRGLSTASHIITLGALAGLTSVMLVMLLGQTRVLYSMANDGLLPKKFFAAVHPKFRWQSNSYRRYRTNGEHRYVAGVCDRIDFGDRVALHEPQPAAAIPDALGAADSDTRRNLQRLHDVQAGLGELGPAVYLARDWTGCVFHLQREAQPGAGTCEGGWAEGYALG